MGNFNYDEIKKYSGWNDKGELFIPESCYECTLSEDVYMSYSKCMGDGKDIELPYEKCVKDCPIRKAIKETRGEPDLMRKLHILKVFSSRITNADKVIEEAIKLLN